MPTTLKRVFKGALPLFFIVISAILLGNFLFPEEQMAGRRTGQFPVQLVSSNALACFSLFLFQFTYFLAIATALDPAFRQTIANTFINRMRVIGSITIGLVWLDSFLGGEVLKESLVFCHNYLLSEAHYHLHSFVCNDPLLSFRCATSLTWEDHDPLLGFLCLSSFSFLCNLIYILFAESHYGYLLWFVCVPFFGGSFYFTLLLESPAALMLGPLVEKVQLHLLDGGLLERYGIKNLHHPEGTFLPNPSGTPLDREALLKEIHKASTMKVEEFMAKNPSEDQKHRFNEWRKYLRGDDMYMQSAKSMGLIKPAEVHKEILEGLSKKDQRPFTMFDAMTYDILCRHAITYHNMNVGNAVPTRLIQTPKDFFFGDLDVVEPKGVKTPEPERCYHTLDRLSTAGIETSLHRYFCNDFLYKILPEEDFQKIVKVERPLKRENGDLWVTFNDGFVMQFDFKFSLKVIDDTIGDKKVNKLLDKSTKVFEQAKNRHFVFTAHQVKTSQIMPPLSHEHSVEKTKQPYFLPGQELILYPPIKPNFAEHDFETLD